MLDGKKLMKELGTIVVCLAILAYVLIHLMINFTNGVAVETAYLVSIEDSFTTDGYIMRDEELVVLDKTGMIVPAVSEGDRVSVGTALFSIYEGENDAGIESEIADIDNKIRILEKSSSETSNFMSEIGRIDEKISAGIADVLAHTSTNSLASASNITDDVLINMNRRWLITKGETSFTEKIEELKKRKNELQSTLSGVPERYYSKVTGYFSGNLDGYENIFDASMLDEMSTQDFEEMIKKEPDMESISKASGKIVRGIKWRVMFTKPKHEVKDFVVGNYYPVIFPYSYNTEINMNLERIISETDGSTAVMVFSTSYMPKDFNYMRKQEVEVVKRRVTGYKVKKTAMRHIEGDIRSERQIEQASQSGIQPTEEMLEKINGPHKGVFILDGNTVRFRYAEEIGSFDDYYIIDAEKTSYQDHEGNDKYSASERLALYDQVIVEGKDLYVGKIVD